MSGDLATSVIMDIIDAMAECKDHRVRRWLLLAALLLFFANLSFTFVAVAVGEARLFDALGGLLLTSSAVFGTGVSLLRAIWIAFTAERVAIPATWKWLAFVGLMTIVAVPAPLLLLGVLVVVLVYWQRRLGSTSPARQKDS
jgi:hypothetical protein